MAKEITVFVHGEEEYKNALLTTEKLFTNQSAPIEFIERRRSEKFRWCCSIRIFFLEKINTGGLMSLGESFLAETNIFPSKGEARKTVQGGGVSINRKKIDNLQLVVNSSLLLHQKYLLVQKGKKNYYLVKAV